ncbi:SAM-dependent methyltransferase [candidate division WS5 bacterium]|uniref:SAM-dependent methyltransferase n=1 Tax=candidate division WS5 bacterium TaxID=2093353 RepID=A0A419DED3_9BACT|nr:MAG: SAM-dependent methyltransferase [candidate division WS5 bacterium]
MKTVMSKKGVPISSKVRSAYNLYNAYKKRGFADAKRTLFHHQRLTGYLIKYVGIPVHNANILEIGCGQIPNQVALFHAEGANIIGIDIDVPTYEITFPIFLKIIRTNGFERAIKSIVRHWLFDKNFFKDLAKEYGQTVRFDNIDTRIMDATNMAFESESFDFIYSNVVFQHIDNVERAASEVNRVLKPGGIAAIHIHLFASLSGGICLEWLNPEQSPSAKVPPWDHIRDMKYPVNVHLNKMTINQYRGIFGACTNIVDEQTVVEGEKFLTEEIEYELKNKGFTREDLLTRTVLFIVGKKVV